MSTIKIDTAAVAALNGSLASIQQSLGDCARQTKSIRGNLGMRLRSSEAIDEQFEVILASLQDRQTSLTNYENLLTSANDRFSAADQRIAKQAQETKNWLDSISGFVLAISPLTLAGLTEITAANELTGLFCRDVPAASEKTILSRLGDVISTGWENVKTAIKGMKGEKDIAELIDALSSAEGIDDFIKDIKGATDSAFFKTLGGIIDAEKITKAWNEGDADTVKDVIVKYIKKGVTLATGVTGFSSVVFANIGWNLGENFADIDKYANPMTQTDSNFVSCCKYIWHVTGDTVIEGVTETAYDIVDSVDGIFGWDVDAAYKNLVGVGGVEGVLKAEKQVLNYFIEDPGGTTKIIADGICAWGKGVVDHVAGWFH